jgi:hypothetical protein
MQSLVEKRFEWASAVRADVTWLLSDLGAASGRAWRAGRKSLRAHEDDRLE